MARGANHNFIRGIDWNDNTGQTENAGTQFISKSGGQPPLWDNLTSYDEFDVVEYNSDVYQSNVNGNIGNQPDISAQWDFVTNGYGSSIAPYLDLTDAIANRPAGNTDLILGNGIYKETIGNNSIELFGDIKCEIVNPTGLTDAFNTGGQRFILDNLRFSQWINCLTRQAGNVDNTINDCEFLDCVNVIWLNSGANVGVITNNVFLKGQTTFDLREFDPGINVSNNMFLEMDLEFIDNTGGGPYTTTMSNNLFYNMNSLVFPNNDIAERVEFCCFFNTEITVDTTTYPTLLDDQNAGLFPNCIEADPLFLGNPSAFEYIVSAASPLLFNGLLGTNIANAKTGNLQNSTTFEWGTNPLSNSNTIFVAGPNGEYLELDGVNDGFRISQVIDLGRIYDSPTIKLNGLSDYLNNVPTNPGAQLRNPNPLTVAVTYSIDNINFTTPKFFRLDYPLWLDSDGNSTAEQDFAEGDRVANRMRYLGITFSLTNNYTES